MNAHRHADQMGQGLRDFEGQPVHFAIPDATTVAERWAQRTSASQADYLRGVETTDKDPTALAIAGGQRYIQAVTEAFNSGKWANGLRRSGKAGWQQAVRDKGAAAFSAGVMASQSKVQSAFGPLLAFEQNLQNQISSMPNVTDLDRENRALAWMRGMRTYVRPS